MELNLTSILVTSIGNSLLLNLMGSYCDVIEVNIEQKDFNKNETLYTLLESNSKNRIKINEFGDNKCDFTFEIRSAWDLIDVYMQIASYAHNESVVKKKYYKIRNYFFAKYSKNNNYFNIRQNNIESRNFNVLTSVKKDYISKKSSDKLKLVKEIEWFQKTDFLKISPKLIAYEFGESAEYTLNFEKCLTLSEILLFFELNNKEIFRIGLMLQESLSKIWSNGQLNKSIESENKEMYIHKTWERYEALLKQNNFLTKCHDFRLNSRIIDNKMFELLQNLEGICNKLKNDSAWIHGDPVFSNILVNLNPEKMLFIDPRGSYGKFDIIGSMSYDLSKIYQSLYGNYDALNSNLFDIKSVDEINIYSNSNYTKLQIELRDYFDSQLNRFNLNLEELKVLTSSLWIGLTPLHSENVERQVISLMKGLNFV